MFSAVKISSLAVDVSIVEVSGFVTAVVVVVCSVDASVVNMNFGSRIGLGEEFLLRALTMMPPSTFTVTVFNVVTGSIVVVVVVCDVFDIETVLIGVVVVEVVEDVVGVVAVEDVVGVVAVENVVAVVAKVEETFLLRGLAGGVIRIEGRFLGFSELFPLESLVGTSVVCSSDIS